MLPLDRIGLTSLVERGVQDQMKGEEREENWRIFLELGRGPSTSPSPSHALSRAPPHMPHMRGSPFGVWRRVHLPHPPMRRLPFSTPSNSNFDKSFPPFIQ